MAKLDQYAQLAYMDVTVPDGGTLTYKLLQIAQASVQAPKMGLKIHRIAVDFNAFDVRVNNLGTANSYYSTVALTVSNNPTTFSYSQPEVIYAHTRSTILKTAVGFSYGNEAILEKDFTTFPGGGILIPADRLYMGAVSTDLDAAVSYSMRIWYTAVELTAQDYLELVESRTMLNP